MLILKAGSKKKEDKEMAENRLTAEQIQLVDVIAKCSQIASWTLTNPWVTTAKKNSSK